VNDCPESLNDCGHESGIALAEDGTLGISAHFDGLDADAARVAGRALSELADRLTPSDPGALAVVAGMAEIIGGLTVEDLAREVGADSDELTAADVDRMARWLGSHAAGMRG
jgi:hypothetical protein